MSDRSSQDYLRNITNRVPAELWLDAFHYSSRRTLEICQLVCRKFDGIVVANKDTLPDREGCKVLCYPDFAIVNTDTVPNFITVRSTTRLTVATLQGLNQQLYGDFRVLSLSVYHSSPTDEYFDRLVMYFTKMTDANHLHINNYGPVDPKHHEKLRNRLPHLCCFSIGCKPESFVWSSLKEAWLLSVPRFKTFFDYGNGSDRRRTVTVTDHTLLMSYIFDFSLLQPGDAKSVEMETALVSDEFLRMLVKRFLLVERTLTVVLGRENTDPVVYLRFTDFEETSRPGEDDTVVYRYWHRTSGAAFFSELTRFTITNDADEASKKGIKNDLSRSE